MTSTFKTMGIVHFPAQYFKTVFNPKAKSKLNPKSMLLFAKSERQIEMEKIILMA